MNERTPTDSEFAAGSFGRLQGGQLRPLTRDERMQAERSARIRGITFEEAAAQLANSNHPSPHRYH